MRFSKLCALAALAAATMGFASAQAAQTPNPVKVFYYSLNDLFINQLSVSIQDRALANSMKIAQYDANGDLMRQLNQIQTALSVRKDRTPILVNPVDTQNGSAALRAARQAKVPVIFFNRKPDESALKAYEDAWYVGTNSLKAGAYQAEVVADYLKANKSADKNKNGVIDFVMLKGEAGHQDTQARSNVFLRTLIAQGYKLNQLDSAYSNWSQATAQKDMLNMLNRINLKDIELIVCNNDAMALGAIAALQSQGYNLPINNLAYDDEGFDDEESSAALNNKSKAAKANNSKDKDNKFIPVVGIDAIPPALDAIERGTMLGTVLNDASSTGDVLIRIAVAYREGTEITANYLGYPIDNRIIEIPYVKVTNANIDSVRQ